MEKSGPSKAHIFLMKSFLLYALKISKRSMSYSLKSESLLIHIRLQLGATVSRSEAPVSESVLMGTTQCMQKDRELNKMFD